MGQRLTRPIRNFNVENRAAKALDKHQKAPKAAPKHASTADAVAQMQHDNPEIMLEVENKNERLHENLKQLYVDSKDPPIQIKSTRSAVQLARRAMADPNLGVMDTEVEVPQGRSSLRTLMGFISSHHENPSHHSVAAIAKEHHLDDAAVQNVLAHFKVMQLHIPKEMFKEDKNMSKIVSEQLKASQKIASSFKLEGQDSDSVKKIPGNPSTGDIKS